MALNCVPPPVLKIFVSRRSNWLKRSPYQVPGGMTFDFDGSPLRMRPSVHERIAAVRPSRRCAAGPGWFCSVAAIWMSYGRVYDPRNFTCVSQAWLASQYDCGVTGEVAARSLNWISGWAVTRSQLLVLVAPVLSPPWISRLSRRPSIVTSKPCQFWLWPPKLLAAVKMLSGLWMVSGRWSYSMSDCGRSGFRSRSPCGMSTL